MLLNHALEEGESVLFEGAQGTMLDIDHGTYPFVTSSSATSGGAVIGTGVAPNAIDSVIGVTKAYCTRVGEGPFPSEEKGELGEQLRKRGNEYGAVTGRPRRTGWLDLPLLRYAGMINGISWLVVTKLDVLDELAEIPVCVGYKINGKRTDEAPAQVQRLRKNRVRLRESARLADFHRGHHRVRKTAQARPRILDIRRERSRSPSRHDFYRTRPRPHHHRGRIRSGVEDGREESLELLPRTTQG